MKTEPKPSDRELPQGGRPTVSVVVAREPLVPVPGVTAPAPSAAQWPSPPAAKTTSRSASVRRA